jgi:hypothetical protein
VIIIRGVEQVNSTKHTESLAGDRERVRETEITTAEMSQRKLFPSSP